MKNIKRIAMVLMIWLIIAGCERDDTLTIVGSGDVISRELDLPVFKGINVTGKCDVETVIGKTQFVEFYAQSEILDVLKYEVRSGILYIGFPPGYSVKTNKDISAYIVIPSVSFLSITGEGNFKLSGAPQDNLDIRITGSGNVKSYEMEVKECAISISGVGNCEVNVMNTLNVTISGMGNVMYMGSPSLTTDVSGIGSVNAITP